MTRKMDINRVHCHEKQAPVDVRATPFGTSGMVLMISRWMTVAMPEPCNVNITVSREITFILKAVFQMTGARFLWVALTNF